MPTETVGLNSADDYNVSGDAEDMHMGQADANDSYWYEGANTPHTYGSGDHGHVLLSFAGLSNISGPVTVSAATVYAYYKAGSGNASHTVEFNRVLADWDYSSSYSTWNNRSSGNSWNTGGATGSGSDIDSTASATDLDTTTSVGYDSFTSTGIETDVEDWINGDESNYGWMVQRDDGGATTGQYLQWGNSRYGDSNGEYPYLSVTHAAGGGGGISMPVAAFHRRQFNR